jgi:hypothetical protein
MSDLEVPLEGGNVTAGVVRVGDTVRRPQHPNRPLVHAVLRHLEDVGFEHSPRLLGIDDQGREILTFAPGHTIWSGRRALVDDGTALDTIGHIVRALHDAMASFPGRPERDGTVLLHGDLAPWNVVVGEDGRWTIIDWDGVGAERPVWELAYVLYTFVPLWPVSTIADDDAEIVRRIGVLGDAYGADEAQLGEALGLVPDRCRKVAAWTEAAATAGGAGARQLVADGHPKMWRDGADHVAERLPRWLRR